MTQSALHIAVGVVVNPRGEVLIARRPPGVHLAGLWEFPGGKAEQGEHVLQALARELREEVGISLHGARPLLRTLHHYPEKSVLLDVWRVERWQGHAAGLEGQEIRWVPPDRLGELEFPPADLPIIAAVRLPPLYLISAEPGTDIRRFFTTLEACLEAGVRLLQLRSRLLKGEPYRLLVGEVKRLCAAYGARLLVNASPGEAVSLDAHGVHLNSARLLQLQERPLSAEFWVAASCHNAMEVEHAVRVGVDFVVVSPVQPTPSHPDAEPIGWEGLSALTERATVPVYALGGMQPGHMDQAWEAGGQGIAMISGIWNAPEPGAAVRRCYSQVHWREQLADLPYVTH